MKKINLNSICENCGHDYSLHTYFTVKNIPCIHGIDKGKECGCDKFKYNGIEYGPYNK